MPKVCVCVCEGGGTKEGESCEAEPFNLWALMLSPDSVRTELIIGHPVSVTENCL